jgi:hypothetical protein
MTKARLEVGREEKHIIEADCSSWTGRLKVLVDAREVSKTMAFFTLGSKAVKFMVVGKEQYQIELRVGEVMTAKLELYVDRRLEGAT